MECYYKVINIFINISHITITIMNLKIIRCRNLEICVFKAFLNALCNILNFLNFTPYLIRNFQLIKIVLINAEVIQKLCCKRATNKFSMENLNSRAKWLIQEIILTIDDFRSPFQFKKAAIKVILRRGSPN